MGRGGRGSVELVQDVVLTGKNLLLPCAKALKKNDVILFQGDTRGKVTQGQLSAAQNLAWLVFLKYACRLFNPISRSGNSVP